MNDSCWNEAGIASDFVTQLPQPGLAMPQATEVKVLHTQEALYVGFYCKDSAPDSILKQLSGRDTEGNSDWCSIMINCYQDGINGLMFAISPNGEQWDGKMLGAEEPDVSWNAVWDCKTRIVSDGWCAEFKIPFAAIRFPDIPIQQWDINFGREIRRHRVIGTWNPVDPNGPGDLVQMGVLKGVEHVQPPKRIFFFPYASGYYNFGSGANNFSYNLGLDLKLGLGDAFTLDGTLIPDFGQTLSDQRILNLTPFEIQFQDNRQFFMEGTELFNKAGVFYSRRIGGLPVGYSGAFGQTDSAEAVVSNPS
ncbi:MAG: hydrolase, partial [Gammaproteobacteria bacterium]|nr:hydrolase [Gammaproteobacteria bacterium]